MVDDPLLQREGAHPRGLARVRRRVGPRHRGDSVNASLGRFEDRRRVHRAIVVFDLVRALLLLRERDVEVEVEVAPVRRGPRKRSSPCGACTPGGPRAAPATRPSSRRRGSRDGRRSRRSRRRSSSTPGSRPCTRPKHEVVHEELGAAAEEVRKRRAPLVGLEAVVLLDADPRERLPLLRELVSEPGVAPSRPRAAQAGRRATPRVFLSDGRSSAPLRQLMKRTVRRLARRPRRAGAARRGL